MNAEQIIEMLELEPLPGEGGFFRETYRASGAMPGPEGFGGDRTYSTQIYYLLRAGSVSRMHRVRSDEVFHHYLGAPVTQLQISGAGDCAVVSIGPNLAAGHRPQVVVPAGVWQGAFLDSDDPAAFALLGCTVSPGFEWEDFELVDSLTGPVLRAWAGCHAQVVERLL